MDIDRVLQVAVERIVADFAPLRVFVFGSRAWGSPDDESDIDLLVVVPDDSDAARLSADIRFALRDLPAAFDVVVRRRQPWEQWSSVPVTLEHRIAQRGRIVYDAAA